MTDDLAIGMSELTALLLTGGEVDGLLCAVADIVARMLPDHPMVGVTLTRDERTLVGGSTDAHAMLVEESLIGGDHSPCHEAFTTAQQVSVADIADEQRWGEYSTRMLARGVKAVFAQPLVTDGTAIGSLSLYASRTDGPSEQARRATVLTAEHIGVLLGVAIDTDRQTRLTRQLRAALASRSTIDQALGIIMAQRRCTRDVAFGRLRETSQWRNVKVADLAARIIESVSGERPATTHFDEPGPALRPHESR